MPLRIRLATLLALAAASLLTVVAVVFLLQLRVNLNATLDTSLQSRSAAISDEYADGGPARLRLTQDEEPVQVLGLDGRIVASSPQIDSGPVIDDPTRRRAVSLNMVGAPAISFTIVNANHESTRYRVSLLPGPPEEILVVGTGLTLPKPLTIV